MKQRSKQKKRNQQFAQDHIKAMYVMLIAIRGASERLANRYVYLIRRLTRKFRLHLPREVKRSYCKHCYVALIPFKNYFVRVKKGRIIYHCANCGSVFRIPFSRLKK